MELGITYSATGRWLRAGSISGALGTIYEILGLWSPMLGWATTTLASRELWRPISGLASITLALMAHGFLGMARGLIIELEIATCITIIGVEPWGRYRAIEHTLRLRQFWLLVPIVSVEIAPRWTNGKGRSSEKSPTGALVSRAYVALCPRKPASVGVDVVGANPLASGHGSTTKEVVVANPTRSLHGSIPV